MQEEEFDVRAFDTAQLPIHNETPNSYYRSIIEYQLAQDLSPRCLVVKGDDPGQSHKYGPYCPRHGNLALSLGVVLMRQSHKRVKLRDAWQTND